MTGQRKEPTFVPSTSSVPIHQDFVFPRTASALLIALAIVLSRRTLLRIIALLRALQVKILLQNGKGILLRLDGLLLGLLLRIPLIFECKYLVIRVTLIKPGLGISSISCGVFFFFFLYGSGIELHFLRPQKALIRSLLDEKVLGKDGRDLWIFLENGANCGLETLGLDGLH